MLDLAQVKAHLRVTHDHEDLLILGYVEAAIESAEAFTNRDYSSGEAEEMSAAAKAAVLLMVGHLYENRQSVVTGTIATEIPMAARYLLWPLRRRIYPLGAPK